MKYLFDVSAQEAKKHFLKGSSYFNGDFPDYIGFEPLLEEVAGVLAGGSYLGHMNGKEKPYNYQGVNYNFVSNKDGRFAWRPYELMHPVIYASLVNLLCDDANWAQLTARLSAFTHGVVTCCSSPVLSADQQSDQATQVRNWWQEVEQQSLKCSLEYSHVLHTDVTDCYGSLYTHSISWALHGLSVAKQSKGKRDLLGDQIDGHIRACRHGQTNGISQGSVLMDVLAELVLGYVDELITEELGAAHDFRILRYRDDYRIFANNDVRAEQILKVVSDKLRSVGMRLGVTKTIMNTNVVEGSIKSDKLAGLDLQDLGEANAKTIQKQLLRLHSFGRRFPNSGALRRLVAEFHSKIAAQPGTPDDLEVQIAIATDIGFVSPLAFPAVAGILSHLIALAPQPEKAKLWSRVQQKMARVPYNGYLEVWLQRVTKPAGVGLEFVSQEAICRVVNGEICQLWESDWIANASLKKALESNKIIVGDASQVPERLKPEEVELFTKNAWAY